MPNRKSLRRIVADNVAHLRGARALSQPQVSAAAKHAGLIVGQTTVGRVERAAHAADVDTLEALAKGLDVEAWQLLVDTVDAAALPTLGEDHLTADERQLLKAYRDATDGWRLTLRLMARTPVDEQPKLSRDMNILMTTIFDGPTASNERVADSYGTAPHVEQRKTLLHQEPAHYRKKNK